MFHKMLLAFGVVGLFGFSWGSKADLSVSPWNIDFGTVTEGSFPPSQTVWIRNYGPETTNVNIRDTFCYPEFDVQDNCYRELGQHESCTLRVRFNPRREGYFDCQIEVTDDAYGREVVRVRGRVLRR